MITARQTEVFADWLKGLRDTTAKAHILRRLKRFANGNLGDVKAVGEGISEVRIHHGARYRVYFLQKGDTVIVLLCGGI